MFLLVVNATVQSNAFYGSGEGPIFFDGVSCTGREDRLLECPNDGLQVHSCNHNNDAGVECVPGNF